MDKPAATPRILCVNGSLRGREGNTARVVAHLMEHGGARAHMSELCLATMQQDVAALEKAFDDADAFVFCTGNYWSDHGSVLQRFIEVATAWEATTKFLGKPAGVVVTMDSVGGMDVATRLLGVLNLLGCMIAPLGTVVLSRAGQVATQAADEPDIYTLQDAALLLENIVAASAGPRPAWHPWQVKPTQPTHGRYPGVAPLHVDRAPWLRA